MLAASIMVLQLACKLFKSFPSSPSKKAVKQVLNYSLPIFCLAPTFSSREFWRNLTYIRFKKMLIERERTFSRSCWCLSSLFLFISSTFCSRFIRIVSRALYLLTFSSSTSLYEIWIIVIRKKNLDVCKSLEKTINSFSVLF